MYIYEHINQTQIRNMDSEDLRHSNEKDLQKKKKKKLHRRNYFKSNEQKSKVYFVFAAIFFSFRFLFYSDNLSLV